jgi:acylphosphatase
LPRFVRIVVFLFMDKHFKIKVSGKVQGVFFRASTKTKADELSINGFVRNEPDGNVYIEAEGDEEALKNFIEWCRRGPQNARVIKCDVTEDELQKYENFRIHR